MDQFTTELNRTVNNQLLKHAASLHIFCPNCEHILDYKTVVILEVWDKHQTQYHGQQVCCKACLKPDAIPAIEKSKGLRILTTKYI